MLKLKNISKYYHQTGNVVKALDSIDLTFENNEFVVITGESGSGKSTLLNVISGLDTYEDGEMVFLNQETAYFSKTQWEAYRKNNIGFIFQNYNIIESFTVYENVEMSALIKGYDPDKRKAHVLNMIESVGLKGKEKQKCSTLSGGEKQRVAIARALAKDAPLIIADEPTGNLDKKTGESILKLLKEIAKDKLVLLVSHSFESVEPYATRHVRLFDGEVTLDKTLKQTSPSAAKEIESDQPLTWWTLLAIAFKNIFSTPKRSVFTFLISVFMVLVFALVYGSYVQQINSVPGNSFVQGFNHVTENRLIITKTNHEAFSDSEVASFMNHSDVIDVLAYDPVLDLDVHIPFVNGNESFSFGGGAILPSTLIQQRNLESGRLPQNDGEVVIASNEDYEIGDEVSLAFAHTFRGGQQQADAYYITKEVVGLMDAPGRFSFTVYASRDFFEDPLVKAYAFFRNNQIMAEYETNDETSGYGINTYDVLLTTSIDENDLWLSDYIRNGIGIDNGSPIDLTFNDSFSRDDHIKSFNLLELSALNGNHGLIIHPNGLSALFEDIPSYQITVLVEDSFDAQTVMDSIDSETYNTLYPAEQSDPFNQLARVMLSIFFGGISIGVAFIMYFVGYLSLKNVMSAKKKDYVILRAIGISKKELNRITILEMVLNMMLALILVFIVLIINENYLYWLPNYLRFYNVLNYIFLIVVLVGLSIFLALRFNKKLFDISVISAFKEQ